MKAVSLIVASLAPTLAFSPTARPTLPRSAARALAPEMKDPALEVLEEVVNYVPILVPFGVLGIMIADNGGVGSDTYWDGTAMRAKGASLSRVQASAETPSSDSAFQSWLDSNKGGGATDFEYNGYSKGILELPEIDSDEVSELLTTPAAIVVAILLLTDISLAANAGVNSLPGFLGFSGGQFMKALYDGWNLVAPSAGLGGAILKY